MPEPEPLRVVVEPASDPGPVTVPNPEYQPLVAEAAEPLPDFIVQPGSTPQRPPPPPAPEPQPEPDLGPLPDYIVDPTKPPAPTPPPERKAAAPAPKPFKVEAEPTSDKPPEATAGLNFPPATSFPTLREDDDADAGRRKDPSKTARRRPAPAAGMSKRVKSEAAEPGDEAEEVSWMQGLSNRLSAYSLAEEEAGSDHEPDEGKPEDAETAG